MKARLLAVALLLLASTEARAQAAGSGPSVERTERLLVLLGTREIYDETRTQLVRNLAENPLLGQHADLVEQFLVRVAPYDSVHATLVATYRERLSLQQVDALIAFYEIPQNRDLALLLGRINIQAGQILNERVNRRMPELTQELMSRMTRP